MSSFSLEGRITIAGLAFVSCRMSFLKQCFSVLVYLPMISLLNCFISQYYNQGQFPSSECFHLHSFPLSDGIRTVRIVLIHILVSNLFVILDSKLTPSRVNIVVIFKIVVMITRNAFQCSSLIQCWLEVRSVPSRKSILRFDLNGIKLNFIFLIVSISGNAYSVGYVQY